MISENEASQINFKKERRKILRLYENEHNSKYLPLLHIFFIYSLPDLHSNRQRKYQKKINKPKR